jgi:hypothetical protein
VWFQVRVFASAPVLRGRAVGDARWLIRPTSVDACIIDECDFRHIQMSEMQMGVLISGVEALAQTRRGSWIMSFVQSFGASGPRFRQWFVIAVGPLVANCPLGQIGGDAIAVDGITSGKSLTRSKIAAR